MSKQLALVDGTALTRQNVLSSIDEEIERLYKTGDVNRAAHVLNSLDSIDNVTGQAKAKFLFGMQSWYSANKPTENFGDYVESISDTKAVTVKRYTTVWKYVEDCTIPKEIAERPMRDLVPIASTLSQGYEIGKAEWRTISLCASNSELLNVLRKIRGKKERKSARVIKLSRDGSLNGWKDNKKYFIGFLNIKEAETDGVLAEFIEKIKISSGVIDE